MKMINVLCFAVAVSLVFGFTVLSVADDNQAVIRDINVVLPDDIGQIAQNDIRIDDVTLSPDGGMVQLSGRDGVTLSDTIGQLVQVPGVEDVLSPDCHLAQNVNPPATNYTYDGYTDPDANRLVKIVYPGNVPKFTYTYDDNNFDMTPSPLGSTAPTGIIDNGNIPNMPDVVWVHAKLPIVTGGQAPVYNLNGKTAAIFKDPHINVALPVNVKDLNGSWIKAIFSKDIEDFCTAVINLDDDVVAGKIQTLPDGSFRLMAKPIEHLEKNMDSVSRGLTDPSQAIKKMESKFDNDKHVSLVQVSGDNYINISENN